MILCNCRLIQIEMKMKPWLKVSRLVAPMPYLERDLKDIISYMEWVERKGSRAG
jgi:hypothetical protein